MTKHLSIVLFVLLLAGCSGSGDLDETSPWPPPSARATLTGRIAEAKYAEPAEPDPADLPDLDDGATLADVLQYAAMTNPSLKAAFGRWKAAVAGARGADAPPDPRFTYRYFIREVETRVGPQRQAVGLSQTFPWFGTLALRRDAAARTARAAGARFEAERRRLALDVKRAWFDYYYLGRSIAVTGDNVRLLKLIEGVVRARFKAAGAEHPDLLRVQIELGKLDDRLTSLEDMQTATRARLNALLNRKAEAELALPESLSPPAIEADYETLRARLPRDNPELVALAFEIESRRTKAELAGKAFWPDVTVGVDYIDVGTSTGGRNPEDDGKDAWSAMVSVNLPVWREKYRAERKRRRLEAMASRQSRADRVNALSARLQRDLYDYRDARRRIDLYTTNLIPRATQSFNTIRANYQGGKSTFTDLIDAERVLLEFEMALEQARVDAATAAANVEALVGKIGPLKSTKGE